MGATTGPGSRQLVRWDVLVARIVGCGGHHLLTGATLPYGRETAEDLQEIVGRMMARSDEFIDAGKQAVRELVGDLDDGSAAYDFSWMWQELGLERDV